jgi:glycosyltransferase involved in cell wall biosynthesis
MTSLVSSNEREAGGLSTGEFQPGRLATSRYRVLNYVSECAQVGASGGWDGISVGLATELAAKFRLQYVGPIRVGFDHPTRLISKVRRIIGARGAFSAYSDRRLAAFAREVDAQAAPDADADFFHGATPWVRCTPPRPYFAYIDASFHTYLRHYHEPDDWLGGDLARIFQLEKNWLAKAERVFVSSDWATKELRKAYRFEGHNLESVGVGGRMPVPSADGYRGGKNFLAVMTDFQRKGGPVCLEAFRRVRQQCPDATLTFVGRAPADVAFHPEVSYAGFLRKDVPEQYGRLIELFSSAFALVLPSRAETSPILLAEAGCFGCPAIAPARFGIPEMVIDGRTGILLQGEPDAANVAASMLRLCRAGEGYLQMRKQARKHCIENFTWTKVVDRITWWLRTADPTSL